MALLTMPARPFSRMREKVRDSRDEGSRGSVFALIRPLATFSRKREKERAA